jgi:hypothetical protein
MIGQVLPGALVSQPEDTHKQQVDQRQREIITGWGDGVSSFI